MGPGPPYIFLFPQGTRDLKFEVQASILACPIFYPIEHFLGRRVVRWEWHMFSIRFPEWHLIFTKNWGASALPGPLHLKVRCKSAPLLLFSDFLSFWGCIMHDEIFLGLWTVSFFGGFGSTLGVFAVIVVDCCVLSVCFVHLLGVVLWVFVFWERNSVEFCSIFPIYCLSYLK